MSGGFVVEIEVVDLPKPAQKRTFDTIVYFGGRKERRD